MDKKLIIDISESVGTPFYVYDYDVLKCRFFQLKSALPDFAHIYYSVKANPSLSVCQIMNRFATNAEVSSLGEIYSALKAGFQGERVLFSGPGKTREELTFAIKSNIKINVESISEINLINEICKEYNLISNILIRINPNFSYIKNGIIMSGIASQFGIDISEIEVALKIINNANRLCLRGISVYLGSQILETNVIIENSRNILKLFLDLQSKYCLRMKELNLGGGFGISYYNEKELDLLGLKVEISNLFNEYKNKLNGVDIYFESGRFLVADSGSFITKVLYQKYSKGKEYLICDGGFNNILISSFFTREIKGNFPIICIETKGTSNVDIRKEYYITGPLCSPNDIIGSKVILSPIEGGDLLEIKKVGAYGLTYSPLLFISHLSPAEIMIKDKEYYVIRKKSLNEDLFNNQQLLPQDFWKSKEGER